MKVLSRSINLLTAIFGSLAVNFLFNVSVQTQEIDSTQNQVASERSQNSSQKNKLDFSGDGRPGRRQGGGSRSPIPVSKIPLTALVPENNIGTTVRDRPSFWFYVPYRPQQVGTVEFVLQDERENDVYRQTFALSATPGVVNLKLPQDAPSLTVNQSYHWYFKLDYDDFPSASANFVEGWVERISLSPDLAALRQKKKVATYQEYGKESVWFDSLDNLAQLRLNSDNPQLKHDWNQLLSAKGIGLDEIVKEPLTGKVSRTTQNK